MIISMPLSLFQRRQKDNLFVVNILLQRANIERIDDRQIQNDLGILVSELQSLCNIVISYD